MTTSLARVIALVLVAGTLAGCTDWGDDAGPSPSPSSSPSQSRALVRAVLTPADPATAEQLEESRTVITARLAALGVAGASVEVREGSLEVRAPALPQETLDFLVRPARLQFRGVLHQAPPSGPVPNPPAALPPAYAALDCTQETLRETDRTSGDLDGPAAACDRAGTIRYLLDKVELTGSAIEQASASEQGGQGGGWLIEVRFDTAGGELLADLTLRYTGRQLAIVLDGVVQSAPTIVTAITGGEAQITGAFTEAEARGLAAVLSSGSLPVDLSGVTQRP